MFYREAGDFKTSYKQDSQTFPIRIDRLGYYVTLAIAFLVVPFIINDYWANAILLPFLIYAIASIGLNILVGYAGQVSLGTGGFMAVGAYACYKLMTSMPEVSMFVHILLAGGITAVVCIVFGLPSLRIKGFYLAVATLAAQFFLVWLFNRVRGSTTIPLRDRSAHPSAKCLGSSSPAPTHQRHQPTCSALYSLPFRL